MKLTKEELKFISTTFTKHSKRSLPSKLSLSESLPDTLKSVLNNATLTLLAELGDYQLWFPLELKVDELGQFTPVLKAPEVIEKFGVERSWRFSDVSLENDEFIIRSLSSSGVVLKPKQRHFKLSQPQQVAFMLPGNKRVSLLIEPIRRTTTGIAAKITRVTVGQKALRKFLFDQHKLQNSALYTCNDSPFSAF